MEHINQLFKKNELIFALIMIFIYCLLNSIGNILCDITQTYYIYTLFINIILILFILYWIKYNHLNHYYGLCIGKDHRILLYYIPLIIFVSHYLWTGISIKNSINEIMIYILFMFTVGFLEEVIFRGFLFKALAKENIKKAIIISSMTFGIGHILNLFNGSGISLINNLTQIIGAIIIGLLFILIFIYSQSIIPCIIFHSINNALTIFSNQNTNYLFIINLIIIIIYSYYIYVLTKKSGLRVKNGG